VRILAQDEEKAAFWRRHTYVGVVLCVLLPAIVVLDTLLTGDRQHLGAKLVVCLGFALLSPLLLLVPVDRVVRHPLGRLFFDAWEAAGLLGVLAAVALDGGARSPYTSFLYVLLAHAALAYPPAGMVLAGCLAVAGYLAVGVLVGDVTAHHLVTGSLTLLMSTATCAFASYNHVLAYRRTATRARRAARLAEVDGLTGCLHNRAFHQRLASAAAVTDEASPLSVIVVDVDDFKSVNDTHGHPAGDAVLGGVGAILRQVSRAGDAAGRLGGDEFALMVPGTSSADAKEVGERVRREVARLAGAVEVTVSVGVATCTRRSDGTALLVAADRALYQAKRAGRDQVAETPLVAG